MNQSAFYDDTKLWKMFDELSPKHRMRAMKSAFRQAANDVRKKAREELSEEIEADAHVLRGIRSVVYKRKLGFRVTVGTKRTKRKGEDGGKTGARNRRKEIVPLWMQGTDDRYRGRGKSIFRKLRRKFGQAGHTGRLKHHEFMEKAERYGSTTVQATLKGKIIKTIERTARKYGSTVS